jgi:hypothetical protein
MVDAEAAVLPAARAERLRASDFGRLHLAAGGIGSAADARFPSALV